MMNKRVIRLVFFFLAIGSGVICAAQPVIDLQSQWKQYDATLGTYSAVEKREKEAVYFLVNANQYSKHDLIIKSLNTCSIFVNGELFYSGNAWKVSVDSLAQVSHSTLLTIGVFQPRAGFGLQTFLSPPQRNQEFQPELRSGIYLRDFVVTSIVVLVILLVVLIRLNPKLASDYFSVMQVFSNRESNDMQVQTRIASSSNILFYVFCSLLVGFCLMLVFSFVSGYYPVALQFQSSDFFSSLFNWLKVSALVLLFFFIKIVLIYSLGRIFQVKGITGMYFFNWVRVLLLSTGVISLVLFVYFIRYGTNENFFRILFEMLPWLLAAWMVLIGFKLRQKLDGSMFHLFSYICATELIPFLITIKVLFS